MLLAHKAQIEKTKSLVEGQPTPVHRLIITEPLTRCAFWLFANINGNARTKERRKRSGYSFDDDFVRFFLKAENVKILPFVKDTASIATVCLVSPCGNRLTQ